jgi:hypothetical protein
MTFATEFPDFPGSDMPPMPQGFDDTSWHNDACPSYRSEALGLVVFIDYVDHAKREMPEYGVRFILLADDDSCHEIAASDEWSEITAAIDNCRKEKR